MNLRIEFRLGFLGNRKKFNGTPVIHRRHVQGTRPQRGTLCSLHKNSLTCFNLLKKMSKCSKKLIILVRLYFHWYHNYEMSHTPILKTNCFVKQISLTHPLGSRLQEESNILWLSFLLHPRRSKQLTCTRIIIVNRIYFSELFLFFQCFAYDYYTLRYSL